MTRFVFQGSGHTTGPDMKGIAAVVAIAVLAYEGLKSAARTAGDVALIVTVAAVALVVGAAVMFAVVRARGRRRPAPRSQVQLWHANPQALPPREVRAIAPAPQVVVNIDAGLLAGLMRGAQQQPAPVIVRSETQELPR